MNQDNLNKEKILDVDIVRSEGMAGSVALAQFLKGLVQKYPDRAYAPGVVDEMSPDRVTYIAKNADNVAGMWDGIRSGRTFRGRLFVIDPKYQSTNVAKKIQQAIFADFDEARILVYPFGQKKTLTPERFEARRRALVVYYEKLGFVIDKSAATPDEDVVPMVWRKADQAQKKKEV